MKSEVKQEWLERLRSGKYKQGTHYLVSNDSYCCIGVLCDIVNAWDTTVDAGEGRLFIRTPSDLLGISHDIGQTLVRMNDTGKDFNEIADYIEENVPTE